MQRITSTRARRPRAIRPMIRGSHVDWSLGHEKPGRKTGKHHNGGGGIKVGGRSMGDVGVRR